MVLLEAVAQLPVQPVLVLTGDTDANPDYVASLRSFATQAGLEKLIFAGHVANMPQVLAAADLAVLPSLEPEPFGRTAIEAQAAARVVIASDEGGFRETVLAIKDSPEESADVSAKESAKESAEEIEVATGLRVPPNDPTALADAIHQVMSMTAEQRAAMGMRGRARVMAQFTTARLCSETLNIYHELIGG
jgi:glycosyltransferase involved in cell wall biosynthesis